MNLDELRTEIDDVDDNIIGLLKKRFEIVRIIGSVKNGEGLLVRQPEREKAILDRLKNNFRESGINDEFVDELYEIIFAESRNIQEK